MFNNTLSNVMTGTYNSDYIHTIVACPVFRAWLWTIECLLLTGDVVSSAGERGVRDERLWKLSEVEFQETGHCVGVLL